MQSAVVFGICRLIENESESLAVLKRLAMKYYPSEQLDDAEIKRAGKVAQMLEIRIEHLSGKEVQER